MKPQTQQTTSLPDGWRWEKLGKICTMNPTKPKDFKRQADTPTSFIPMEAIDEKIGAAKPVTKAYSAIARGYTFFAENDVLFAKITPCMQNGKSAIVRGLTDGIGFGSTEFHVLRAKENILPEWIFYLVRNPDFRRLAEQQFDGSAGQQRVPNDFMYNALVPLPPTLEEQRSIAKRISTRLAEAERIRQAAERQYEAAKSLAGAIVREAFPFHHDISEQR